MLNRTVFCSLVLLIFNSTAASATFHEFFGSATCTEDNDDGESLQTRLRQYLLQRPVLTLPNNEPPISYNSYTSLCLTYTYGGFFRGNMGGFCDYATQVPSLVFGLDVGDYQLQNDNFLRGICRLRCRCTRTLRSSVDQILDNLRPLPVITDAQSAILANNYWLIEQGDFPSWMRGAISFYGYGWTGAIWCHDRSIGSTTPEKIRTALDLSRDNDHMPNLLRSVEYNNMTALCASAEFGGLPDSNMGGVCLPSRRGGQVLFWGAGRTTRWGNGDPRIRPNAALRSLCLTYCRCADQAPGATGTLRPAKPLGPISDAEAELWVQQQRASRSSSGNNLVDTAGPDGGFRPVATQLTCLAQGRCTNFKCNTRSGGDSCRCLAGDMDSSGRFRSMSCGVLQGQVRQTLAGITTSFLGGRDLGQDRTGCPCNITYVSESCCYSDSRLVWEPTRLKLGSLHSSLH